MTADVNNPGVLILSTDVMVAALLGALVELEGMTPVFPRAGEGEREALLRARPRVVLVDCDHGTACADAFFGPATMAGARVVLYSGRDPAPEIAQLADRHRAVFLRMPVDTPMLARVLAQTEGE